MKLDWYEARRLRILAQDVAGKRVLDLGNAQLPNPYFARSGATSVTGFDLREISVPEGYDSQLQGDVTKLESVFSETCFDVVIAGELIEHLEDPYNFLRQVRSVLTHRGRFVLSTPNPLGFPVVFAELFRSRRWFYTDDHVHYFLPRWVFRMLERSGFRVCRVLPVGLWLPWPRVRACPALLSYQLVYVAERA